MSGRPQGGADSRRPAAGRRMTAYDKHQARPGTCERCGADILRQRNGLPWVVTADPDRLTPGQAAALVTPNRLAWCLRESKWTGQRLVEVSPVFHSPTCCWAHVIEHKCPPGTKTYGRRPEGAMW